MHKLNLNREKSIVIGETAKQEVRFFYKDYKCNTKKVILHYLKLDENIIRAEDVFEWTWFFNGNKCVCYETELRSLLEYYFGSDIESEFWNADVEVNLWDTVLSAVQHICSSLNHGS